MMLAAMLCGVHRWSAGVLLNAVSASRAILSAFMCRGSASASCGLSLSMKAENLATSLPPPRVVAGALPAICFNAWVLTWWPFVVGERGILRARRSRMA